MNGGGFLLFVLVGVIIVAAIIFGAIAARQRREAMLALAARLGLRYSPDHDYGTGQYYGFLNALAQGDDRYAFNVLSGQYGGAEVVSFDYHYETHSTDSKGHRQTSHHYLSVFALSLPMSFPELRIAKEGIFSKIAQAFGYQDIDFESAEFSRTFCVRSGDKKFAYDFCNAQMMEYLLANRDLSIEVEGSSLAFVFPGQLKIDEIESNLSRLLKVRSLMPEYLFTKV